MDPAASGFSQEAMPEDPPGFFKSLTALLQLLYSPARGLETLFAVTWPRFLVLLLAGYLVVPFLGTVMIRKDAPHEMLYFRIYEMLPLGPDAFHRSHLLFLSLAVFGFVIIAGIAQRQVLRWQREVLSIFDSVAITSYALFPFFVILSILLCLQAAHLGVGPDSLKPIAQKLHTVMLVALFPAALMGLHIWYLALYMLTEIEPRRLGGVIVLCLLTPWVFVLLLVLTANVTKNTDILPLSGGDEFDHLRHAIEQQNVPEWEIKYLPPTPGAQPID